MVSPHLNLKGFADGHSVNISFKAKDQDQEKHCITNLENCSVSINDGMNQNRLKMNSENLYCLVLLNFYHIAL